MGDADAMPGTVYQNEWQCARTDLCSVVNVFISRDVTRESSLDLLLSNTNYLPKVPKMSHFFFLDVSAETHARDQDCYGLDG